MFIDKLEDKVNKYNNTYHNRIKMRPVGVKDKTYIDFGKKNNYKDHKFGDYVQISKNKNIFAKGYTLNWCEEVLLIKRWKYAVPWAYSTNDFNGEEIVWTFCERGLQNTSHGEFRIEKVIKIKGDKLNVKWIGFDNFRNSWIDKKDVVWNERILL